VAGGLARGLVAQAEPRRKACDSLKSRIVSFESLLNLLWACMGLGALVGLAWSETRRVGCDWRARAGRLLAVVFAIIFLFPCVSESDDLMTMQALQFTFETRGELGSTSPSDPYEKPAARLERFFESLQTFQIAALCSLLLVLQCIAFLRSPSARPSERRLLVASGRAPPPVFRSSGS